MIDKKILLLITICLVLFIGCTSKEDVLMGTSESEETESETMSIMYNENDVRNQVGNEDLHEFENEVQYEDEESEPIIYGTWYLEKIVLKSEEYDNISADSRTWYGKEEEFLGKELEFAKDYIRLGDESFQNPNYTSKYITFNEYKSGGKFRQPHPYEVIEVEDIEISNREKYKDLADVELLSYSIEFDDEYPLPYGTYVVILNDDTMFVGGWGKVVLAYRLQ